MARRRLNKKVFAVLMGLLVICGSGVFLWAKFRNAHADPRRMEAQGDEAFAKGDYLTAYNSYTAAVGADNRNVSLLLKLGDTCVKRTREDHKFLEEGLAHWRKAINEDRTYKPAMEKLILSEFEQIDLTPKEQTQQLSILFDDIRVRADQILAIEPNNQQAKTWRNLATVRQWQIARSVKPEERDAAMKSLAEVAAKDPANVEAVFNLARTKLEIGREYLNGNDKLNSARYFADSMDVMNNALAAGQAKNADLQYHAFLVFDELSRLDPKAEERKHREHSGECIAAAAANVTEKVKDFDDIILRWSDWQLLQGKPEEARKIRQKLYEDHPNNQNARIHWARLLASPPAKTEPAKAAEDRAKAIEILSKEIPLPPDVVGAGALKHRELQARTLIELINIHFQDTETETDADKKTKALASAEEALDRLKRLINSPRHPTILGLEAQVLLFKNRSVEAVKLMEDAYRQFRPGVNKDYQLMYRLALTYADRTNQPGSARKLCEEIVSENPVGWLNTRALLVRLYAGEGKVDQARIQLESIRRQSPKYPDLYKLELSLLLTGASPAQCNEILQHLPERDPADPDNKDKTMQNMAIKYEVAVRADRPDVQIDVLNKMILLDTKNVRLVGLLVQLYKARDWNDRAMVLVDRALAANPDDPTIKLIKSELSGTPAEELRQQIRKQIETANSKDPFALELRLYELERTPGGSFQAGIDHLKNAEKLKPDDRTVQEFLFKEYIAQRDFDNAKPHLDRLVKMNADGVGGRLFRHRFAKEKGDFIEAEKIGQELKTNYPEFALSWFALGQAQIGLGQYREAISSFTEVLARQPNNYEASRSLVDAFYFDGQTEKAEAKLREMVNNPAFASDPIIRELYYNHLANFGKPDQAIPYRKDQLARNPKDPWSYLALAATYFKNAQRLALEGNADESKKNIELAFDTLSRGREQFPNDTRFYAQVAEIHQYNGKLDQAEQVLKAYCDAELAKPAPAKIRPDPWLALAEFYVRSGQMDKAVGAMNEALVHSNDDLTTRLRLVSVMVQAHQFADAVKTLDAVRDNPDPRIRRQRLEILIAQGSLDDAERQIRAELSQPKNDSAELRNLLASVLIDTNRANDAVVELNKALAMDHGNEASRYLRALAYAKRPAPSLTALQKNQQDAINELIELDKTQRNPVQTRLLLAELYEKTGRRDQGIARLEDVLKKNPGSREVRLTLVRMYRAKRPPSYAAAQALVTQAENDPVLKTDPVWHREAAILFQDQRQYRAAVVKMTEALRLAPGNNEYRRQFVDMLIRLNDFAGALIQTDQLLRDGIDNWWVRMERGVATGRQVNADMMARARTDPAVAKQIREIQSQATAEFDQALSMVRDDTEKTITIFRSMGETIGYDPVLTRLAPRIAGDTTNDWKVLALAMKRAKGDFAGAIADGERMLADPSNGPNAPQRRIPILRALADVYQNQSPPDFKKAKDRYEELLKYDPNDMLSLNNLAYILAELSSPPDPKGARQWSKRAFDLTLSQNEPDPLVRDTHGWVLTLCGGSDLQEGMLILRKVAEVRPDLAEVHYHLGEAYLKLDRLSDAEKELDEARKLLESDESAGVKIDTKLRDRNLTTLGKVRELLKVRPAA